MKHKTKETIQYCTYCGMQNDSKTKVCKKCDKKLEKPHEIRDYFKSKIKEEYQDNVKDTIWSILENFIKSHLYGTVVTCSIVFTVTSLVVTNLNHQQIEKVTKRPEVVTMQYAYAGKDLEGLAFCQKYLDAILAEDIETVKGLQLENFYPDIYREIVEYYHTQNTPGCAYYYLPCIHHDLVANAKIYESHNNREEPFYVSGTYNGEFLLGGNIGALGKKNGIYEKYDIQNIDCMFVYHYKDVDYRNNPSDLYVRNELYIKDEIEIINIDGNWYVIGEGPDYMETDFATMVARKRLLQEGNGDLAMLGIYLDLYDKYITEEDFSHVFDTDNTYWRKRCDEINPKIVPKLYD